MMHIIFYLLLISGLTNMIFGWCKKRHELGFEKATKIGRLEAEIGIEAPENRDFDLTLSCHPLWYITFQLSLWSTYINFGWSRNEYSYPDCDHKGVECYFCGCKNRCGEDK